MIGSLGGATLFAPIGCAGTAAFWLIRSFFSD